MKANKSLLAAAVLSTALTALAQNPGGMNPGTGGTSPDPSNETNTTNASGARTESDVRGRAGADVNTVQGSDQYQNDAARTTSSADDMNQPKRKRSFWDRLFGRNKHLDSDSSGRTQP